MILLLLFTIIIIVCIVCLCEGVKREKMKKTDDDRYMIIIIPLLVFFGLWLGVLLNMCDIKGYTEQQISKYTILKERVEDKNLSNYSFHVLNDLYKDVKWMDATIARNKRYQKNPFTWGMFSDTVGELEPLEPIFNNSYKNTHYTWENFAN